jgi:hypothetical protein
VIFERKPLFVTETPFPRVPAATLFEDTWLEHIVRGHVYMQGREAEVRAVVASPTAVVSGTSNPDYVVFLNQSVTTSGGTPLAVIVDPQEQIICTAYYNRSLKVVAADRVLWLP